MRFDFLTIGLAWLILTCSGAFASDSVTPGDPVGDQVFSVSSNRLEADEGSRRMTFVGDVVGRQGNLVIYAARLTVFFEPDRLEVDRILASGDVRIVQDERVATADQAVFFRQDGKIILTGSPKVHQGGNSVEGEEITIFLDDRKSVVNGGQSRVNAIFHPSEKRP